MTTRLGTASIEVRVRAGVLIGAQDVPLTFPYLVRFEHNTIAFNDVITPVTSILFGTGFSLFDCCYYVAGDGVVIQENLPPPVTPPPSTDDRNWYSFSPNVNLFTYSRMPVCSPPSPGDILGTPATNPTSNTMAAVLGDLLGHQDATSVSTLDNADPVLESLYLANAYLDEDFDRESRLDGVAMDIGADELIVVAPEFRRGDADGSTSLNIVDAIFLLNWLFVPSSPAPGCESSTDVNDDETVNIVDPIYLLNYLFAGGTAPPLPHPACGVDPSNGSLTCLVTPCP